MYREANCSSFWQELGREPEIEDAEDVDMRCQIYTVASRLYGLWSAHQVDTYVIAFFTPLS